MEPSRPRSETEHERLGSGAGYESSPVAADPYRGTAPWQREGGSSWKRGLAGLGAVLLTAGSISAVAWLAFRDDDPAPEDLGEVISARCNITEADEDAGGVDPMEPGAPAERSIATVQTNYGDIAVLLWGDLAPCGVEAFTHLAQTGFYASHACDRLTTQSVDPTAILRCGSPGLDPAAEEETDETYGPGWRFQAETGMAGNDVADVLALVTDDRGRAGSAFALIRGAAIPTAGVSVIGGIVDGYEVLDQIAALSTTVAYDDVPPVPVEVWGVTVTDLGDLPTGPDTVGENTPTAAGTTGTAAPTADPTAIGTATSTPGETPTR
ncbi:peptidylprolyl isomerase [Glycomyces harbinensis]|uniref:Peptidyl-prolyl cis-trans isomerase (Rotamase)-cyclophilin family n=1 Tax=Glycomyces harbinensis TaxID=58114 RepID=A0A1G6VWL4_9ACTN|nr:peptidylprolyl isomerase [Glycomyces harbinensis]SDD57206.1 Peptidyl-prolyl cis-trans isomerase (rotamase)-cyclophilin family [Glycomyces harbinensis]